MIADVNGETLTLIDAVRGADGLASRIAPDTPLIVLTARRDELARIRYLDRGSDDVLAKPYSYSELRARIRALLRRAGGRRAGRVMRVGELEIDTLAPHRARRRHAGRARRQGVRAARAPRRRADARVHQGRAAARRLGLPHARQQPHAGQRTPAGCASSCAPPRRRRAGSRTSGASATGSRPSACASPTRARHERGANRCGAAPLRRGDPPARRSRCAAAPRSPAARRCAQLRPSAIAPGRGADRPQRPMARRQAQRAKIIGGACVVCRQTKGITPAHLAPRSLGGCDHPDCVVPMCWLHHRAYDTGRLDLLPTSSRAGGPRSRTPSRTSG